MSVHPSFTSVLVANRGEIALRVMRAIRSAGLGSVAVYTQADAGAAHVRMADRAVCIGEGPVGDSYLSAERILDAARQTGAGAVHPGYGFLSENAGFARACAAAGLVFIGPSPDAIALMGDKAQAKALMIKAGVPCVPGYQGADQSDARLVAEAAEIGFPVMIKAAAGGGGRGMRLVSEPSGFVDALHLARAEAAAGFGSDLMILEKAMIRPRHVEVQVIADRAGAVLHLGERDCSVQRRHQKVVEEAPCPVMTPDLRARMGAAAVDAARAVGYEGAGTVEFLLDDSGAFYFLEMNTRLQVEHPVTELVTGHDLVALQLSVAQGAPLGFAQKDVALTGHAIEARLYAEDPARDFRPDSGDIVLWQPPMGAGIRVDDGIATGQVVSPFYDPMLAKIIAHGDTRDQARQRLIAALQDTVLFGVGSNRDFLGTVLRATDFVAGQATTALIDELGTIQTPLGSGDIALAAGLVYRALQARSAEVAVVTAELLGWGSPGALNAVLHLSLEGEVHLVRVRETGEGALDLAVMGAAHVFTGQGADVRIDGLRVDLRGHHYDGAHIHVATGRRLFSLAHDQGVTRAVHAKGGGDLRAPMHGVLAKICVTPGDIVQVGTRLAVLEAMKMQQDLLSEVAGTVRVVSMTAGTQVKAGDLLAEIAVKDAE